MNPRFARWLAAGMLLAALTGSASALDVLTFHYNAQRTGWNSVETALRPDTISTSSFGKLWYAPLDGQVYGASLIVTGMEIGGAVRDVVYAATENNSIYALDSETGKVLWQNHVAPALTQAQFEQTIGLGSCPNINPIHGITGTPVIDRASNTLYACSLILVSSLQTYELFAVDLTTGKTKPGWPVALEGHDRTLTFHANQNTQRGSLTLLNGVVYVPFSSRCDIGEWHGWIIGVPVTGTPTPQFFTTCLNQSGAGIWGSGGPTADGSGSLYVVTGNGDFNLPSGGNDFGQTIARLTLSSTGITFSKKPADYYTPSNYVQQNQGDQDLGGSSAIVLPDHVGSQTPHLLVTGGKDGILYLVNRDSLGGLGGELDKARMFASGDSSVVRTTPACFIADDGSYYIYAAPEVYGSLSTAAAIRGVAAYRLVVDPTTHKSRLSFAWTNKNRFLFPGTPAVSSNGGHDAILWAIDTGKTFQHTDTGGPGSLHAFDALTGRELYSSAQLTSRDGLGEARKFSTPTIANGRVYLAGGAVNPKTNGVAAYGLFPAPGDVDDNGSVDIRDAEVALESAIGLVTLTPGQFHAADMNADGAVDLKDAVLVLRKALGL